MRYSDEFWPAPRFQIFPASYSSGPKDTHRPPRSALGNLPRAPRSILSGISREVRLIMETILRRSAAGCNREDHPNERRMPFGKSIAHSGLHAVVFATRICLCISLSRGLRHAALAPWMWRSCLIALSEPIVAARLLRHLMTCAQSQFAARTLRHGACHAAQ